MKTLLILVLITAAHCAMAQQEHIQYAYDNSGNRTGRIYSPSRLAEQDPNEEIRISNGLSVFPNPAAESIHVFIDRLDEGETAEIRMFDLQGRLVLKQMQSSRFASFLLTELAAGTYCLQVLISNESMSCMIRKN